VLPYILAIEPSCRRDTFKMLLKDFSDEYSLFLLKEILLIFIAFMVFKPAAYSKDKK